MLLIKVKIIMAAYSPPTTPQIDPDIRRDLLNCLDQEIKATQTKQDEMQRRLHHERQRATIHSPMSQFEDADTDGNEELDHQRVIEQSVQHDYSFSLTGITTPTTKVEASRPSI